MGHSDYHALIASVESSNLGEMGLQFTARYTLARAKDNLSSTFSEGQNAFNLGFLDALNPDLDYGYADFDVRHRFVGSFNFDTGQATGFNTHQNDFVRNTLGGWTLTGIVNVRSGTPFSVYDCTNAFFQVCPRVTNDGSLALRVPKNPAGTDQPNEFLLLDLTNVTDHHFDPVTGTGEFGPFPSNMTARNAFRGPGFWNVDFGVHKNIRFGERYSLQLRGELFNAFNHANLFLDGASVDVTEGTVKGFKTGSRNVQLAVKFIF
jgi:hypothetical protein